MRYHRFHKPGNISESWNATLSSHVFVIRSCTGSRTTRQSRSRSINRFQRTLHGHFAVQVLMWNPQVFPAQPEQYTAGLYVTIQPNGTVLTAPYGTDVGDMEVWHEIDTNAAGAQVIRFPFTIPGFGP